MKPSAYVSMATLIAMSAGLLFVPMPGWLVRVAYNTGALFYWLFAIVAVVLLLSIQAYLFAPVVFGKDSGATRTRLLKAIEYIQEVAPLLGFLGTLVGLIDAFNDLGAGAAVLDLVGAMGVAMTTSLIGVVLSLAAFTFRYGALTFQKASNSSLSPQS